MSSRRKSSTPCMVRVVYDAPRPLSDPEEEEEEPMDVADVPSPDVSVDDTTERRRGPSEPPCKTPPTASEKQPQEPTTERPDNPEEKSEQQQEEDTSSSLTPPESQSPQEEEERLGRRNQPSNEDEEDAAMEDDCAMHIKDDDGGAKDSGEGLGDDREEEAEEEEEESEKRLQQQGGRKYECKYCPFSTQNLDGFKEHVDSSHPNVILNPLYLCAVCNFSTKKFDSLTEHNESRHPGETNFKFKRVKNQNNQTTILEQTIEGVDNSAECDHLTNGQRLGECSSSSGDGLAFPSCISATLTSPSSDGVLPFYQGNNGLKSQLDNFLLQQQQKVAAAAAAAAADQQQQQQITALNINGTVIIHPDPALFQGLGSHYNHLHQQPQHHHVTPHLQRPPNFSHVPKIAVPLNTTKYNPSLDSNATLITSFSRFPYPTHAELSWLTAASKHPEEQIKVWFTTQRLKQGITWSPEEVEEARKKMFNGSIPPAHHTFTAAAAKASQQTVVHTTVEHAGQKTPASSLSNAVTVTTTTTSVPPGHHLHHHHHHNNHHNHHAASAPKRPLPAAAGGGTGGMFAPPESKRPVMAVAPHSGGSGDHPSKDKGLMAPPPPPPPLKDYHQRPLLLPMAPPPVPAETTTTAKTRLSAGANGAALPVAGELKRSPSATAASVPLLMPPPSSALSPSSSNKGKLLAAAAPLSASSTIFGSNNNHKSSRPVVSLPSILFQQSLSRPFLAPPPIIAPPYKNYLIPHPSSSSSSSSSSSINSKDKNPITHALLAPDMKLPNSPPLVAPQIRRPPIIQSASRGGPAASSSASPLKAPSSSSHHHHHHHHNNNNNSNPMAGGFPSPKSKEHGEQKRDKAPLSEANGVSHHGPSWSSHEHVHNNGFAATQLYDQQPKSLAPAVPTQFPLLERMKGKTAEQLKILEENFLRKSFPTHADVDKLALATCLSRQEIESWFEERRALRDNLEQALLNSMGSKRMVAGGFGMMGNGNGGEKRHQHMHHHHQPMQLNGIHKPSVKSPPPLPPPPPPILPIVAPLVPPSVPSSNPASPCSVPADRRSPAALLKDVSSAQARWPSSPEELSQQLEARTASLPRTGPFAGVPAPPGPKDWTELFYKLRAGAVGGGGVNGSAGGQSVGPSAVSSSDTVSSIIQRCQDGGGGGGVGGKMSDAELGRLAAELRPKSLSIQQHQDLHDWLSGRLRPQSAAELKNGLQGGAVGPVFGSWLDDGGHLRRVRELALEREKKMVEDASGRLTG